MFYFSVDAHGNEIHVTPGPLKPAVDLAHSWEQALHSQALSSEGIRRQALTSRGILPFVDGHGLMEPLQGNTACCRIA